MGERLKDGNIDIVEWGLTSRAQAVPSTFTISWGGVIGNSSGSSGGEIRGGGGSREVDSPNSEGIGCGEGGGQGGGTNKKNDTKDNCGL